MSLTVTIGGTDVTDRVRLSDGYQSITSNADGTYAACGLKVDDPDSSLSIGRFQQVIIEESDCTARPRMFTGYVIEARPSRGPFRSGVERVWNLDVGDLNILLHTEAFHLANAKRPQETGTARRDWLLGTSPGSYFVNNGFFPTFAGLFDEADYRRQYADSVLATYGDIGRIGFLYWDDPDIAVYCAGANDGFATSSLSISNVLGDVNFTTVFPPDPAAELEIDMSEVYDEVYLTGPFGTYFAADHDGRLPSGIHRTGVFDLPRVGRLTTAASEAVTLLARYAGDVESITCTIQLPSDKVNLIDAGMLVPVKFSHLPGYSSGYVNLRAAQRTVNLAQVTDGSNLFYELTLKLNLRGVSVSGGGGGTSVFPHQNTCTTPSLVHAETVTGVTGVSITPSVAPTPGNTIIIAVASRTGGVSAPVFTTVGSPSAGYTAIPEAGVDGWPSGSRELAIFYKAASSADAAEIQALTASSAALRWEEWSGSISYDTSNELRTADPLNTNTATGAAVTPTSGVPAVIFGAFALGTDIDGLGDMTPDAGWTEGADTLVGGQQPRLFTVYRTETSTSGSYTPGGTHSGGDQMVADGHGYGTQTVAFVCNVATEPPAPGQPVGPETVTMSGADGTTAFPFADGSLRVYVDDTNQTAAITTSDGAAGTFTLAFTPTSTETVVVYYQGR